MPNHTGQFLTKIDRYMYVSLVIFFKMRIGYQKTKPSVDIQGCIEVSGKIVVIDRVFKVDSVVSTANSVSVLKDIDFFPSYFEDMKQTTERGCATSRLTSMVLI